MAKICNNFFESSPSSSYLNEVFNHVTFDDIYNSEYCGVIKPDPIDLFDELQSWPTIHSDLQKIESGGSSPMFAFSFDEDMKPEIRNGDCMWSGSAAAVLSTSVGSTGSDSVPTASVPLSAVTGGTTLAKQSAPPVVVVANNSKLHQTRHSSGGGVGALLKAKTEPSDDYEQQLQQHSIPNSRTAQAQTQQQQHSMQHIPPGTSLLRKSTIAQTQQLQQRKLQKFVNVSTTSMIANNNNHASTSTSKLCASLKSMGVASLPAKQKSVSSNNNNNSNNNGAFSYTSYMTTSSGCVRPDTPQSLDDDDREFKHSVDLAACVIGSNNISLTADPTAFINHVSQELQDTSKDQIETRLINGRPSLAEVYDVIDQDCAKYGGGSSGTTTTASATATVSSSGKTSVIMVTSNMRGINSDCESDEESMPDSRCDSSSYMDCDGDLSPVPSSQNSCRGGNSNGGSSHHPPAYLHSDHSYTRCKDGMDDLGPSLETPSDSDEEIDVVSIGDKKLPTNPSDKDRRALQTKVAYKFSNAHIVKTAKGLRTITPRRRISYELPYTPASSSPVKSVANSRYPSPASTPYQSAANRYAQQQHMLAQLGEAAATPASMVHDKARKRIGVATAAGGATMINGIEYALPPSKKHRGKKASKHPQQQQQPHHHHHHHHHHQSSSASLMECVSPLSIGGGLTSGSCGSGGGDSSPASSSSDSGCGSSLKRHFSIDDTADTIEKRNLHNDMERQRRIGLKNLFEALKKQIPSIKDKERAPKVNILREAAKLCENLTREDRHLNEQKVVLREQLRVRQERLSRLLSAMQRD